MDDPRRGRGGVATATAPASQVRTWLGATLPVRQHMDGSVVPAVPPSNCALVLAQRRVLAPLGLRTAAAHLVHQSSVETDLAPVWPHQYPGMRTRAVYHYYDCHIRFGDCTTERDVEARRPSGDSNPSDDPRCGRGVAATRPPRTIHVVAAASPRLSPTLPLQVALDAAAKTGAGRASMYEGERRAEETEADYVARLGALRVSSELDLVGDSSVGMAARSDPRDEWHFIDRSAADDVPVAPPPLPQLLGELRCRFGDEVLSARQLALLAALFPIAGIAEARSVLMGHNALAADQAKLASRRSQAHDDAPPGSPPKQRMVVYREEILACLADKVTDHRNLERAVRASPCNLGDETWKRLVRRLGALNVYDPVHPDGLYHLELRYPDERRVAGILARLEVKERGTNLKDPVYRRPRRNLPSRTTRLHGISTS